MSKFQKGFTLIELMIVVAIIGILAAVAIPSYQDYTARAQVSEGMSLTSQFKTTLAEYYADQGTYQPSSGDVDIATMGGTTSGKYVADVNFENHDNGTIAVVAIFKTTGVAAAIQGSSFMVETGDGGKTWTCGALASTTPSETLVDSKLMPGSCK